METGGGQITGQVYHDRGKERWEVSMGGMPQVRIMRPDLGKMIMYMPQMNMGMELALDGDPQFGLPADHTGPEPKAVGREDVAGESTTKYRTEVDNGTDAPYHNVFLGDGRRHYHADRGQGTRRRIYHVSEKAIARAAGRRPVRDAGGGATHANQSGNAQPARMRTMIALVLVALGALGGASGAGRKTWRGRKIIR